MIAAHPKHCMIEDPFILGCSLIISRELPLGVKPAFMLFCQRKVMKGASHVCTRPFYAGLVCSTNCAVLRYSA
jgi:hypothetical protein